MSVWDWSRGERGSKITETKCATETVVVAEFHPLEVGVIVSCGKGHVNFWHLDNTSLTLSRKTGLFDQRDKPKYVTCLAFSFTGDVLTGDSNGNVFIWGRGYNAVTKAIRNVHEGPIFSICVLKDGSVVTGGGKDRKLVQFDASYRKTGLEAMVSSESGTKTIIVDFHGFFYNPAPGSLGIGENDLPRQRQPVGDRLDQELHSPGDIRAQLPRNTDRSRRRSLGVGHAPPAKPVPIRWLRQPSAFMGHPYPPSYLEQQHWSKTNLSSYRSLYNLYCRYCRTKLSRHASPRRAR